MKKKRNYGLAALVFIITMILVNISGIILGMGLSLAADFFNIDYSYINNYIQNNMNLLYVLIYLILSAVFLLWYYFAEIDQKGLAVYLKQSTDKISPVTFLWIVILIFAAVHLTSIIMAGIAVLLPEQMEQYTDMIEQSGITDYSIIWVLSSVILPPLAEEIIFRGLIFTYLKKAGIGMLLANLIQAVLFGVFHMNLIQGIYAALLGFLFGYLTCRYESLIIPVVCHGVYNLFGSLLLDLEYRLLPDYIIGMFIFGSIPLFIIFFTFIKYGIGERAKSAGGNSL